MTAKNSQEKEKKQTQNQQSLKGTLAEVLEKNKQHIAPAPTGGKKPFEVSEESLRKVLKGDI